MANKEQVERLKRSVREWNQWRQEHPRILPDLSGIDLSGMNFADADLHKANLTHVDLREAILIRANLREADLGGTYRIIEWTKENGTISEARYHLHGGSNLEEADLTDADLTKANLNHSRIQRANLTRANLTEADLGGAYLNRANLTEANLTQAHLSHTILYSANFTRANLTRTELSTSHLNAVNFTEANLGEAILSGSILYNTIFHKANLSGAYLGDAHFIYTILTNAILAEVRFYNTTFARVDLSSVIGLETAIHEGPSTVNINSTVLPDKEHIRKHFLRGVGFTETQIEYLPSLLTPHPIEYSSLFISYAHQDDTVARRLYADLRKKDVPCWMAPHDLQPGNYFRERIDQAIHSQDKLLLLLSEHSVKSGWVRYEVEQAMARESRQQKEILFPLRLDDAIFDCTANWALSLRSTRHIGDFTGWQEEATYQQAFTTLLKPLKVSKLPVR